MLKERLQEILEFTKSESPYSKANKGWVNQDIFLEFGKSSSTLSNQKEAAKVTLLWPPIQRLITNLLLLFFLASLIVLASLKGSQLKFNLESITVAFKNKVDQIETQRADLETEKTQKFDIIIDTDIEEDFFKEETNLSLIELSGNADSIQSENNISNDLISESGLQQLEEIKIKDDISINNSKRSKSNFF